MNLSRYKIVVDCANGATYNAARKVFKELGASVTSISIEPDGFNINESCGSTHMENVCERVIQEKADFGIAFDGDGDRVLFCDENGEIVDGDELLYLIARDFHSILIVRALLDSDDQPRCRTCFSRTWNSFFRASVGDECNRTHERKEL